MSSFANLKRSSGNSLEKLTQAVESMTKNNYESDSQKYWKPEVDKAGNGFFVIRFLPTPPQDGDDQLPWVRYYDHGFQGPTGLWYIEKSLTTLGQQDAISTLNSELWNSGIEANKEQARKQKRRLHYVSNVYIVRDTKNPENEGTVKLFVYGKKIFDKIIRAMKPEFEDEQSIDPFNFWNGANFKLKIRKVEGHTNYDLSEFDSQSALFDDDDKIEQVWNQTHSLKEILDVKNFKTFETLKERMETVLCLNTGSNSSNKPAINIVENNMKERVVREEKKIESAYTLKPDLEDDFDSKFFNDLLDD